MDRLLAVDLVGIYHHGKINTALSFMYAHRNFESEYRNGAFCTKMPV